MGAERVCLKPIRLNLGCGNDIRTGYINIDFEHHEGVDMVLDLNQYKLPFGDNTVDEIILFHVLEHLTDRYRFIKECWRVLKPDGILHIKLPAKWIELGHQSWEHRKDYFYTVTNDVKETGFQSKKMFEPIYIKGHRKISHLFYRFRDWVLNLFTTEWEYKLKKVRK